MRVQFHPVVITGELEKKFLQIRMREERDALSFHWKLPHQSKVKSCRFIRSLFGLTSSPFLLGEIINQHLISWEVKHPEVVEELRSLYVDELLTSGTTVEEA